MTIHGSCHCGQVTFDFETAPVQAMTCNCSICRRNGTVLHFVPAEDFSLRSGTKALSEYEFNRHVITHYFCRYCGSSVFARIHLPDQPPGVVVNLRCTELDLLLIPTTMFDGAAM
jgi:hypothetical protein